MINHHELLARLETIARASAQPGVRADLAVLILELRGNHAPHMGEQHYDLVTRKWVNAPLPCGMQSAISWTRLVDELRQTGEFRRDEQVGQLAINANGIGFRYETGP